MNSDPPLAFAHTAGASMEEDATKQRQIEVEEKFSVSAKARAFLEVTEYHNETFGGAGKGLLHRRKSDRSLCL